MALVLGGFVEPSVVQLDIELTQPVKQGDQAGERVVHLRERIHLIRKDVEQIVPDSQPDLDRSPEPVGVALIEAVLDSLIEHLEGGPLRQEPTPQLTGRETQELAIRRDRCIPGLLFRRWHNSAGNTASGKVDSLRLYVPGVGRQDRRPFAAQRLDCHRQFYET